MLTALVANIDSGTQQSKAYVSDDESLVYGDVLSRVAGLVLTLLASNDMARPSLPIN